MGIVPSCVEDHDALFPVVNTGVAAGPLIMLLLPASQSRHTLIEIELDQRLALSPCTGFRKSSPPTQPPSHDLWNITDPVSSIPFRIGWGTNRHVLRNDPCRCRVDSLQQLHRSWNFIENFATSFAVMNPANYNRYVRLTSWPAFDTSKQMTPQTEHLSSLGCSLEAQLQFGAVPLKSQTFERQSMDSRSSYIITYVFMMITAFVLAEICSAIPISGSIYIWAAASAGPKYARFFGFLVAWWSCAGWMVFMASICQVRQLWGPLHVTYFPHLAPRPFILICFPA